MRFSILIGIVLLSISLILLSSCGDGNDKPLEPDMRGADYHLLYAPVGDIQRKAYIYSTATGTLVDSNVYTSYPFHDMRFSSDGTLAAYIKSSGPGGANLWVMNYPAGDTIAFTHYYNGRWISIDQTDSYLLARTGDVVTIFTFPSLNIVFSSAVQNGGAGFLTAPFTAYYFSTPDSLFLIDFSRPDSVTVNAVQVRLNETTSLVPSAITVDYRAKIMVLVANDSSGSWIQVYDSDSLTLINQIRSPRRYMAASEAQPGTDRIYLNSSDNTSLSPQNYIDVYDYGLDELEPYLECDDIIIEEGFLPRQVQLTPGGEMLYVLSGAGGLNIKVPVLGIIPANKRVVQILRPSEPWGRVMRINPINWGAVK